MTAYLDVLMTLAQTIRDRQILRFDYAPRDSADKSKQRQPRRVEPHHLITSHGQWYLVAWDLGRDDWRIFSVDRVYRHISLSARFIPRLVPGGGVKEFVSARFKGSDVNDWVCRGTIRLYLPARAVLPFAGDRKVTAVDLNACMLESGSWSWASLAASFGRFNVAMEVVGPPELESAFAVLAERYTQTGKTRPRETSVHT